MRARLVGSNTPQALPCTMAGDARHPAIGGGPFSREKLTEGKSNVKIYGHIPRFFRELPMCGKKFIASFLRLHYLVISFT